MLIPRNLKNKIEKANDFNKTEHSEDELRLWLATYYSALAENILSFAKSRTATKQDSFFKKNIIIYDVYASDNEHHDARHIIPFKEWVCTHDDLLALDDVQQHYDEFLKTYTVSCSSKPKKDDDYKAVINDP